MKKQLTLALFLSCFTAPKLVQAHGITNAKAAELALHRLERLVVLCNLGDANQPTNIPGNPGYNPKACKNDPSKPKKGIDPDYQNKIVGLTMTLLPHQNEEEPTFKASIYQYKGQDNTQRATIITLDEEGRPLSNQEVVGGPALAPNWPEKDPTTLSENALHYILEGAVNQPVLKPYNDKLTSFSIVQGTSAQGQLVAVITVTAQGEIQLLRVRIKTNGDFDSAELVTP